VSQPDANVALPPGVLAVTTYGSVRAETTQALMDLVRHNVTSGLTNVSYAMIQGNLVDKARNESARLMLSNPLLQYLVFLDADMTFAPDTLHKLLLTAFDPKMCAWADVVGAWCPLRGKPYLPTIDTGSGTWEPHDANVGPIEVIRTGSACILIKRHVYERMEFPWYGTRPAPRPIDILAELDNYARCKMDGRNLLREHPTWATLEKCAREDAASQRANPQAQHVGGYFSSVGEDSNFCDKVRALGMRVVVQTDVVCGHIEYQTITAQMHQDAMKESEHLTRLAVGVLE
jgi:hypothetical protein